MTASKHNRTMSIYRVLCLAEEAAPMLEWVQVLRSSTWFSVADPVLASSPLEVPLLLERARSAGTSFAMLVILGSSKDLELDGLLERSWAKQPQLHVVVEPGVLGSLNPALLASRYLHCANLRESTESERRTGLHLLLSQIQCLRGLEGPGSAQEPFVGRDPLRVKQPLPLIPCRNGTEASSLPSPTESTPTPRSHVTPLVQRLEVELARVQSDGHYRFAYLQVELQNHSSDDRQDADARTLEARDRMLSCMQERLRRRDLVCALGSNGIGLVLGELESSRAVAPVLERILAMSTSSYQVMSRSMPVSARVAVVMGSTRFAHVGALLTAAELTLVEARRRGGGGVEFYRDQDPQAPGLERELEEELLQGMRRAEFCLHYQPIISLATGTIAGFEGLLRWNHPVRGLVSPARFIPLLERSGLIQPMGNWVIDQGCEDLEHLQRQRPDSPLFVSVNISRQQLIRPAFAREALESVGRHAIDPAQLCLEITESVALDELGQIKASAEQLRQAGIQISIDDFGAGYSSLSALDQLPADTLKIDRSLVDAVSGSTRRMAILQGMIGVGHALGLKLVGEGIEQPADLESLRRMGCDLVQGFLFSRAVPLEEAKRLLVSAQQW